MCFLRCAIFVLVSMCICVIPSISDIDNSTQPELRPPLMPHRDEQEHLNGPKSQKTQEIPHINITNDSHHGVSQIHLASWRWDEYGKLLTTIIVLILAGIFKLLFHHTPIVPNYMPESCVLMILGIVMGSLIYAEKGDDPSKIEDIKEP